MNTSTIKSHYRWCGCGLLVAGMMTVGGRYQANAGSLIRFEKKVLEERFFAEGAAFGDLNGDDKMDVIYGPFWFEGPEFHIRHEFYVPKEYHINGYSDHFFTFVEDLNDDGALDVLVLGFPGKEARLYLNPGKDKVTKINEWPMTIVADVIDNESPTFVDFNGDGKKEIVCSREGQFGYYRYNEKDVTKPWQWVALTDNVGVQKFTHGLGVGDVDGDGKLDLLEAKRWWQAPREKDGKWVARSFNLMGSGGAQMFAYDFNGDGRNDIITSLNAHQFGLAWFESRMGAKDENGKGPNWVPHMLVGKEPWENEYGVSFSQPHALTMADVNGDGVLDLITGKRYWAHNGKDPNERDAKVLYWFETRRNMEGKVEFVPHLIDDDTGVGTQVVAGDVNGDGLVDVVVGNKAGLRVLLQRREEVDDKRLAQFEPKKIYGPESIKTRDYRTGQSVEEAVKSMILPPGFKAEVIASEPNVVQPIAFCWDERGRIWLLEGNTYPTRAPDGEGRDRILIFEDRDGDGSYETRKVFMEGLNLASGIEVGFGGVWVGAAPYFLFIPDKDGDDRPDGEPEVLLDGWGYHDTHETLNSFIWGPDGWLYGCHGVFTHSKVGRPGAPDTERIPLNAAVWRYHPTRHLFEVVAHGTSNPWGLDFNDKGEFFTTACVIPHLYHIVPGGRYQRQAGQHFNEFTYDDIKTIADFSHYAGSIHENAHWGDRKGKFNLSVPDDTDQAGGGHAHCGLAIYQGQNFPAIYRGALLFGNLHGHRLVHNAVERLGSGYKGERRADFLRSNDFWFIPVTQKVGPDGALYVSDWSDKQVCHQVNPLVWDRSNGRLYRVVYDKLNPWKGDLRKSENDQLVEVALRGGNDWEARMARRLLMERVAEGKYHFDAAKFNVSDANEESVKLRALFLEVSLAGVTGGDAYRQLESDLESVRAWSVRRLWNEASFGNDVELAKVVDLAKRERSGWVRRELASLLQRFPVEKRKDLAEVLLTKKEDESDHNLPLLVWYGIEPLVGENAQVGLELARRCQWEKIKGFIYRRMAASDDGRSVLLSELAHMKDTDLREQMLETILNNGRSGAEMKAPDGWQTVVIKLREGGSPKMQAMVDELAAYFGDTQVLAGFRKVLMDQQAPKEKRELALGVLTKVRDQQSAELLQNLIREQGTLRRKAIQALAFMADDRTGEVLMSQYAKLSAEEKIDAVSTLASSASGAEALLKAVQNGGVARETLSPFLIRQLQALNEKTVNDALALAVGTMNAAKPGVAELKEKWRNVLTLTRLKNADRNDGKVTYLGTCGTCHVLNGEGAHVGPDLTGSNRGNLDYLLDNVLDPNALIGRDYQLNVFTMKDGRVLSGIVKQETAEGYQLVLPGGAAFGVNKNEVKSREISKVSTMPEGLFEALGEEKVINLVAYLQSGSGGAANCDEISQAGLLEAEKLQGVRVTGGMARPQPMGNFKAGNWSGKSQLWWTGGKEGDVLTMEFPVDKAGRHEIKIVLTRAVDYAVIEMAVNGKTVRDPLDLFDPQVLNTEELSLGVHELPKGQHRVEIKILGSNPQAKPAKMVGVDYLRISSAE